MRCPLCGKLAHLSTFDPEDYDVDIELVEMRSLGRGRGFEVTGRYSALDDGDLMARISARLRRLLALIEEAEGGARDAEKEELELAIHHRWVEEIQRKLHSKDERMKALASECDVLKAVIESLESEVASEAEELEALEAEVEATLDMINSSYNTDYDSLEEALEFLLEVALED